MMATTKRTSKRSGSRKLTGTQLKHLAMSHAELLAPMAPKEGESDPFLGHARAVVIVCACANTSPTNLPRTLAQLGVNGIPFQTCVFNGVEHVGYSIDIDAIPNSPNTTLLQVVNVIQNAPRKV
ncbi:MAG: hypothetical protein ABSH28_07905 [Acidobacteriota bacterium]|jgi:hypothetical protein